MGTLENPSELTAIEVPNVSDVVYTLLRDKILRYEYSPGQRLDLAEMEAHLQVSRTPLKDALSRLEAEGLVEIQPRRGTFVAPLTAASLDEAYKIRSAFELYVALCLFKYLTPADMAFFQALREQMNTLAAADDWECNAHAYLQLDQQLHERFVERGGTPKMLQIFQQMNVHMHVMRVAQGYAARDFEAMHFEHEQIFEALESRSSDRLNAVLLNHLESSRMRAYKMLMDRE